MTSQFPLLFSFALLTALPLSAQQAPLRVGVVGLTHTHVHWILGGDVPNNVEIVGIVEPDRALAERYAEEHGYSISLVFDDMEAMIAAAKPEAVTAFGTIYEHLEVVEIAAPKGIHVMVEKPLAVSMKHARKMAALARKHGIHLLTNYETSWYPTNHRAYELLHSGAVGELRKIVVRDGHRGPKKIGVNREFLDWLTDPVQNGGGALMDFGCYGANLATWLQAGKRPKAVMAVTQQLQPENNPKVEDEANIILVYDDATAIIQASWNWPIGRKDMEVYGLTGAIFADDRHHLRLRLAEGYDGFQEEAFTLDELEAPFDNPFALLVSVVRGEVSLPPFALSSLENNLLVMEILDAARKSAKRGRMVKL